MEGGKRKLSKWNLFVKKVYKEGKSKNANYQFKNALADASKRKSEMGSMKHSKKMSVSLAGGRRKTRRRKGSRRRRQKGGERCESLCQNPNYEHYGKRDCLKQCSFDKADEDEE